MAPPVELQVQVSELQWGNSTFVPGPSSVLSDGWQVSLLASAICCLISTLDFLFYFWLKNDSYPYPLTISYGFAAPWSLGLSRLSALYTELPQALQNKQSGRERGPVKVKVKLKVVAIAVRFTALLGKAHWEGRGCVDKPGKIFLDAWFQLPPGIFLENTMGERKQVIVAEPPWHPFGLSVHCHFADWRTRCQVWLELSLI